MEPMMLMTPIAVWEWHIPETWRPPEPMGVAHAWHRIRSTRLEPAIGAALWLRRQSAVAIEVSATDVLGWAHLQHRPLREVLDALQQTGVTWVGAQDAELIADDLREWLQPPYSAAQWLSVHAVAHDLSMATVAGMAIGEWLDRPAAKRQLQQLQPLQRGFHHFELVLDPLRRRFPMLRLPNVVMVLEAIDLIRQMMPTIPIYLQHDYWSTDAIELFQQAGVGGLLMISGRTAT